MRITKRTVATIVLASVIVAAFLDRVVIAQQYPTVSNALFVTPGLVLFGVPFFEKLRLGVLPLVSLPLVVVALLLIPVHSVTDASAWRSAMTT